ncbi:hypothetical protein TTHERM_01076820 (macronuclear) [Tetrahymena thermophila SB210]|uniref:Uncharacterized protein n=1 Tax=Tetrahymena thermophila (strain SB210) TaxID=312017 RepID=Q22C57_TETTS|nr:hypothetical protein TTHERM_01076820 [Tetrahymena thermophila SB210]EAR82855.2 hypothetical protein TTHERM_01076820 [Tetrahymena thermophila SB210]|eukprot:XP_001030518.2 hypothetical protein TTHERM_01076820 [Tetrahymena thermophila SB210]
MSNRKSKKTSNSQDLNDIEISQRVQKKRMKKEEKEEKEQQVEEKIQQVSNQELIFKKPQGRPQYSNNAAMKQQNEKILQSETSPQCTDQRILELGMKVYSTNTPIIKSRINALNMDTYTINPESQFMFSMFRNKQYPVIESKDFSEVTIKPRLPISSQGQIPEFKFQEINMEEIIDNLNECFLIKQQLSQGSNKQTLYEYLYQKKQVVYNRLDIFQKLSEKKYYFTVVHNPNTKNDYDTLYQFFNQIFMEVFQIHFKNKLGNQTPFSEVLFNNLVDKLVVQQPYGCLDLTREQLQNHMLNPTNVQNSKRFIDTVDKNLKHFATFIAGCSKNQSDFVDYVVFNYETVSYFIKKSIPNLKTFDNEMNSKDKQIISTKMIYFHQKEIENLMDKMQKMFNQDLSIQFNLYFAFAVMKKLLFSCDFYGEPLVLFESDNFILANEELQKSYTGKEFDKKNDINKLPYFFNVQSNPCIYKIEQNKQLKIVYEKLNKRLF